jgi:hypothetical protein
VHANRAFVRRVVAFLAGSGIDQFLDLGSGLPTGENVHEVAGRVNPDVRTVYVDVDLNNSGCVHAGIERRCGGWRRRSCGPELGVWGERCPQVGAPGRARLS